MKAYKLFRTRKDGSLGPLFINQKQRIPIGEWMEAESHPTKGYVFRPFWHCTSLPYAPHLSTKGREWYEVEMEEFTEFMRPEHQGGKWFLAQRMRVIRKANVKMAIGMTENGDLKLDVFYKPILGVEAVNITVDFDEDGYIKQ